MPPKKTPKPKTPKVEPPSQAIPSSFVPQVVFPTEFNPLSITTEPNDALKPVVPRPERTFARMTFSALLGSLIAWALVVIVGLSVWDSYGRPRIAYVMSTHATLSPSTPPEQGIPTQSQVTEGAKHDLDAADTPAQTIQMQGRDSNESSTGITFPTVTGTSLPITVHIDIHDRCWAQVTQDGKIIRSGFVPANFSRDYTADSTLEFRLGCPGEAQFWLDNKPVSPVNGAQDPTKVELVTFKAGAQESGR